MTEAFMQWVEKVNPIDKEAIDAGLKPDIMESLTYDAHFWLSAFVKEVQRRAIEQATEQEDFVDFGEVFYAIVRDFGLEERKP